MAEGPRSFQPVAPLEQPAPKQEEEQQQTQQPQRQQGMEPPPPVGSFFDLNPINRPYGLDPMAAMTQQTDLVGNVVDAAGFQGQFTTEQARELVFSERISGIEYGLQQQEIFAALSETGLLDFEQMTPEQITDVVSIVDLDMGAAETLEAVGDWQTRAADAAWVERYNAGGALMTEQGVGGGFRQFINSAWSEGINSYTRGKRRREMWNEMHPQDRKRLMDTYGITPPSAFGRDKENRNHSGLKDNLNFVANTAVQSAWVPVKTLIGAIDWSWRAGMRLYRGDVVREEQQALAQGQTPQDPSSATFLGGVSSAAVEIGRWVNGFNPIRFDSIGQRWRLGNNEAELGGEDVHSPVALERVQTNYELDDSMLGLVQSLSGRMDSSLFGSPLHRMHAGETTAERFLFQIATHTSSMFDNRSEDDAERVEAAAIEQNYSEAMDALLLERVPGTTPEAAQARAGLRLRLMAEPSLMAASMDLAMRGKISMGREFAARTGFRPGTTAFNRASGWMDLWGNVFADPTVVVGKARSLGRVMRAIPRSDSLSAARKMQDVFDGVVRPARTKEAVSVPFLGNGFRRSLDEVSKGIEEGINARINAEFLSQPNIVDNIREAGGVVEEVTRKNTGFNHIAQYQPRFTDYYDEIEEYVYNTIRSQADGPGSLYIPDEGGQLRLAQPVEPQMVLDWMKSTEGVNAVMNGRLGGVMNKTPTIPSQSLVGKYIGGVPHRLKQGLDFVDGITAKVATAKAADGWFDDLGRKTVSDLFSSIEADDLGKVNDADAARRVRVAREVKTQLDEVDDLSDLDPALRAQMREVLEAKSVASREALDRGEDISMSLWNLETVAAKLDSPEAIRRIGLNATMLRGQSTLPQMLRAIRLAKAGNYGMAKKAMAGLGALSWAPVQFVNGLARSFTIVAPSSVLKLGTGGANSSIRNYTALLDPSTRGRLTNAFAAGVTDVDQTAIARNIMLEVADTLGLPYTEYGRRFMDEHMKMFDAVASQRYSSKASSNFLGGVGGQSAAVLDNQLSNQLALPNFTKMQHVATRTASLHELLNPAVISNSKAVDVFIGTIWTPSVLFRLGFGVRTSADEMMAAIARDGVLGALQARVAYSAASDKNVIPSMLRLDQSFARSALRLLAWSPTRKSVANGLSFETRIARGLGLSDEVVEVLRRTQISGRKIDGVPGQTLGTAGARTLLQKAITQSNPYEVAALGVANKLSEYVDWLHKHEWLKAESHQDALRKLGKVQRATAEQRGLMLGGWGPTQVREAFRVAQSKLVPDELYMNVRKMMALEHDVSRHLQNPRELSAAMSQGLYQTQHDDVLRQSRAMGPSSEMVHPSDRRKKMVVEGYEVKARGGVLEPQFLNVLLSNMEEFLDSRAGRLTYNTFTDETVDLGGRLERGEISYGQWREEMHLAIREALDNDTDLLAQFNQQMARSRKLPDGRTVVPNYEETRELAMSVASDVASRDKAAAALLRDGTVLEPSEATRYIGEQGRTALREWMEEQGWEVRVGTRAEDVAPDALGPIGRTVYDEKVVNIYEEEIETFWGRMENLAEERQRVIDENDGVLPEGWDDQYGTDYARAMGANWYESFLWMQENGGSAALREKVYWHEVGHAYLHETVDRTKLPDDVREIEAESFAYAMTEMPFGDRDFVLDLIQSRRVDNTPEPLSRSLDDVLGGMMTDMGAEYIDEAVDGLDSLKDSIRAALNADPEDAIDDVGATNFRLLVLDDQLSSTGLTNRNMYSLLQQMLEDGLYIATKQVDDVDTYANDIIEELAQLTARLGYDAVDGEFPISERVMGEVADYAEYLSAGLSRFDPRVQGTDVLQSIADEGTQRLIDQLVADGLDGIDRDVLERLEQYADVEVPEFQLRGGPSAPLRTPSAGDRAEFVGTEAGSAINRPNTQRDMLRLAREFAGDVYASPSEALDSWADVLIDELEQRYFSSPESVANDIKAGVYQSPPGARLWSVIRTPDGRIEGIVEAGEEAMKSSTVKTELLETVEDHDEALRLLREGKAAPFLRPLTQTEHAAARRAVEDALRDMQDEAFEAFGQDPELEKFAVEGPQTWDDFLQYVAVTTKRNGGQPDKFVVDLLDAVRGHPSNEGANIGPVLDRLVLGLGRDTYQRMRPMTSVDHFREMARRFDEGVEILDPDELQRIGPRLPDRAYGPRMVENDRKIYREFVNNAYGVMMPVVDYLTRHPLLAFFHNQGMQTMRPVILTNRPKQKAVIELIEASDKAMTAGGGLRSKMSRNGYVSIREVKDEFRDLTTRVRSKDEPTVTSKSPAVNELLDGAGISYKAKAGASGKWFWDELLPGMVDEFPALDGEGFVEYWERVSDVVLETEIAMNDAAMTNAMTNLLNYTDNEAVSTMFSSKYRNLFPFYWAQERFLKRVFQSAAYNPQGFARGNAVFRGLGNTTIPMEDEDGNAVFVAPMSGFSTAAAHKWMNVFGHDTDYVIPDSMGKWVFRWDRIVPGGTESPPLPESPNILFGMTGRLIASLFPETEVLVRSVVGDMALNENRAFLESGLPANFVRVLHAMDPEKVQETFSSALITAFQESVDRGEIPDDDATMEEWDHFYLSLSNWTQMNAIQAIWHGFTGVASPQFEAAPGSVHHEWREIMSTYGFDAGREVFRERYPDATLYTLSETETSGGAPVPASRLVDEWLIAHEETVGIYPEGSQFLVPTAEYTNEFVSSAWARMQRLGIRQPRWEGEGKEYIENIHDDLEFQRWAPEYYKKKDESERLVEYYKLMGNGAMRDHEEQKFKEWERGFFSTRPRFEKVRKAQGESAEKRRETLENLREMDRLWQDGDPRVTALIESNERAQTTLEMVRDYDHYIANPQSFSEYDGQQYDLLRMANRRAFIEYWETRVRQDPNNLMHIWERVILPNFPEFNREDSEAMLLGTEMP